MKPVVFFVLTFCCFLPSFAQTSVVIAKTEAPTPFDDESGTFVCMTEARFKEVSQKVSPGNPNFIGIKQKPAKLSDAALYGFNIVINGKNLSWILDRDSKNEYVLYADFNADGNLTNDKPSSFKNVNGKYVTEIHKTLTETVNNQPRKYPYDLRLEVTQELSRDKTEKETVLIMKGKTMRRGSLNLDKRQIAFALIGNDGIYDYDSYRLFFDLNGDGKFDSETKYSPEIYRVDEKFINIGDKGYEYTVNRYGKSLTLKPLGKKLPERADLRVGSLAPDFTFKDLDGNERRLSDFRGKIVLVDIWALWCTPCVREAPKLAEAYKKLKGKNFEIVSLNKNDAIENVRKFIGENQMSWTHTTTDPSFLSLYRVDQYPTYFLIDKDGKIISNTLRPGEEMYKKIEEMSAF